LLASMYFTKHSRKI